MEDDWTVERFDSEPNTKLGQHTYGVKLNKGNIVVLLFWFKTQAEQIALFDAMSSNFKLGINWRARVIPDDPKGLIEIGGVQ